MTLHPVTSPHPSISLATQGHVATVTLDRPETKNGCTGDMWVALGSIFNDLRYSGARAIVLTGAGGNFCSGADLTGVGDAVAAGQVARSSVLDGMRVLADVVLAVHSCPVPVVSKVDGVCVGAGLGLALAADLTWCSDRARFSAIFARRGISLDFGTSWLLRQRLPVHKAKELSLTTRMLSGEEAFQLGLVNAVVPEDELDDATAAVVDTIASGPPIALSITKRELDAASGVSLAQALEVEALGQSVNTQTEDVTEAFTAFVERRAPRFEGR